MRAYGPRRIVRASALVSLKKAVEKGGKKREKTVAIASAARRGAKDKET